MAEHEHEDSVAEDNVQSEPKLHKSELVKINSRYLRGTIREDLAQDTATFAKANAGLLKFHGTYQQDDRDERSSQGKSHIFMVRTKLPGGKLTSQQMLAQLDLCDELGNTTLRVTSRQGLQLHGVVKKYLWSVIHRINGVQLSTLGACGDVNRNVMCCPAPIRSPLYEQTQQLADELAAHFAPRTKGYHEIWLTDVHSGEKQLAEDGNGSEEQVEPIYGRQYLPRKFKMAIAFPHDNCTDVYTNDLGFLAVVRDGKIVGYNLLVGGGQGVTPANKNTFPALAKRMAFVRPEQAVAVAEAVVKVQRDFGNRADRKLARLKYVIHQWGVEQFKRKVEEYYGAPLEDPDPTDVEAFDDHIGWFEQGDGRWFYGLNIENGRIYDNGSMQLKSALREICRRLQPGIRLTPHQSILFTDLAASQRQELESLLRGHGLKLSDEIAEVRRWSMACVAWPTCGLAITESERALPGVIDQMEVELAKLGLSSERFTVRMTGCPNGCARPYNCDIGLVGKARDRYTLLLGGRVLGDRLNFIYKDLVPVNEIVPTLVPLFCFYKQQRAGNESFGEFCHRQGQAALQAFADSFDASACVGD
jgi:sulfite reductase (ferredoxin)